MMNRRYEPVFVDNDDFEDEFDVQSKATPSSGISITALVFTGVVGLILAASIVATVLSGVNYHKNKNIESHVSDIEDELSSLLDDDNGIGSSAFQCEYCSEHDSTNALGRMQQVERDIEQQSQHHSPISYAKYISDPQKYSYRHVILMQSDFDSGTVRILSPGWFILGENVTFNPNRLNDHMPLPSQTQYSSFAYMLGFFAAITVESDNVIVDLNEFTLSQSEEHALQQRFFFLIELNDQPFVSMEGPALFGTNVTFVRNVVVRNGVLGPTAHHGIHGNQGNKIYIHDINVVDREVAGMAFNGFRDTVLERVYVGKVRAVPVRGTYTQSRGLMNFVRMALAFANGLYPVEEAALIAARDNLRTLMNQAYTNIIVDGLGHINCTQHAAACELFDNPSRLPDGGVVYGILFNSMGVAILGFGVGTLHDGVEKFGADIYMTDVRIQETIGHPREVVSLINKTSNIIQHGPTGAVIDVLAASVPPNGAYVGTPLTEVQFALVKLVNVLPPSQRAMFRRMHIEQPLIDWYDGLVTLAQLVNNGYGYMRNGDAQAHVVKGMIGLRVERSAGLCVNNLHVSDTVNFAGKCQSEPLYGETVGVTCPAVNDVSGHPLQGEGDICCQLGDARGITVVESTDVRMRDVHVTNVTSNGSWARGIDTFIGSSSVSFINTDINEIQTAVDCEYEKMCCEDRWQTPKAPQAAGIAFVGIDEEDVCTQNVDVQNVSNGCSVASFSKIF